MWPPINGRQLMDFTGVIVTPKSHGPLLKLLFGPTLYLRDFFLLFCFFFGVGAGSFVDHWVSFCCSNQWCGCGALLFFA